MTPTNSPSALVDKLRARLAPLFPAVREHENSRMIANRNEHLREAYARLAPLHDKLLAVVSAAEWATSTLRNETQRDVAMNALCEALSALEECVK